MGRWITLAVLVALMAALLTVGVVRAQEDSATIQYAEGGTDPVAILTATDPDMVDMDMVGWSLTAGADQDDFAINEEGELSFAIGDDDSPPDYEVPADANTDNTYVVVVTATDSRDNSLVDTFTVNVEVTDVEEPGMVTWTVDPDGAEAALDTTVNGGTPIVQFQPGAALTASVDDDDRANAEKTVPPASVSWQWYRSPSKTAQGTAIEGATMVSYTVQDEAGENDVGMYLRVVASYSVVPGNADSAELVSDYPVHIFREDNTPPEFDPTAVSREVYEGDMGMNVGAPVTATDADRGALNYTIQTNVQVDGSDVFAIDQKTGQITTAIDQDYDTGRRP